MTLLASIFQSIERFLVGIDPPKAGLYAVPCPSGWKPKTAATAKVPKAAKSVKEVAPDDIYTDEEIEAMSAAEFSMKVGGAKGKAEFFKKRDRELARKPETTFDFEAQDLSEYGITDAEYSQMLAYDPPLFDLNLASKVKMAIAQGLSLTSLAERTGKKYQLIRHYSAALKRAKK